MHRIRRGIITALFLYLWVLALFFGVALLAGLNFIPASYNGIAQDAVVLLGVIAFNRWIAHVPVHWWNGRQLGTQLRQALPALIVVGVLCSANVAKLVHLPLSGLVVRYLGYVLLIGITEEYVFRGVLIPLLARTWPRRPLLVVLLSSALFGGLHLINSSHIALTYVLPQILFAMALGTFFAGLYVRTRNLLLPILLHAATDISVVVQLVEHPTSSANLNIEPQLSLIIAAVYGGLLVIALVVASRQVRGIQISTD
ncbi:CPBP family intramembrane glutamic endopeptidase [Lactiplantibacillus modestisalitolerans]|uniref:Lysostaphin resistance A-like protein n=1 Tax=Lactiplantibacillus modestisalitolerans TaxID=1457219 RepID=A0ABV5WU10_9LACO|nr:CPBP family intramembrane glutamic endopeptidase [Lactiplantibacillus modestisalitolerans]